MTCPCGVFCSQTVWGNSLSDIVLTVMVSLTGCGRKLVSRGGYPWLPDLVVVNTVMQSADDRHWVRAIEIAVVPGTGQVCVQGDGLMGSVRDIRPFPTDRVRYLSLRCTSRGK
jgi:hypothetical protein